MSVKKSGSSKGGAVPQELLDGARRGDASALLELDSKGFLLAPGESAEEYAARVEEIVRRAAEFQSELERAGKIEIPGLATLERDRRIGGAMDEAAEITSEAYGFSVDWVPGFFLSKGLGLLWGGCAVSFADDPLPVFLIRAVFAERRKWLFYRREELLAHELCHVARSPLRDAKYEETFAYRVSPSRFRSYFGGCFERQHDALLFLAPFFMLLAAQTAKLYFGMSWIPMPLFWGLTALVPALFLLKNHLARKVLFKAEKSLRRAEIAEPFRLLFRSTAAEIAEIASFAGDSEGLSRWLDGKRASEPRWEVAVASARGD